ncbi:TPA: hypothetical protein QEM49_005040 [Pseudomonas putida]|uniref:hypothetical protein n=1 Tax=Pseudomonas putida TaxID=303 RepID=UPI0023637BC1|nr:hypothetical protein [Pseudomonas putida]ELS0925512.1 hypothetical protein [Pseudomonas putida]MDD2012384.1 hypothetical protein [Pseudomonas putida]HDS1780457.1 hypothetical protein [Pseudomonas putida]
MENSHEIIRDADELPAPTQINTEPTPISSSYSNWSQVINRYASINGFTESQQIHNGVSVISTTGAEIEILVQAIEKAKDGGKILIGFNGAITNRDHSESRPPYFSGKGIASELNMPFVAISDPSLLLDKTLPLGWYAGNGKAPNLLNQIAEIIDSISQKTGCTPIIFGGSGGGFASLAMSQLLKCDSTAMVWNPQTSIGEYAPIHVLHYLRSAFPDQSENIQAAMALEKNEQKTAISSILERSPILHSLCGMAPTGNSKVIYLQNREDWHLQAHAKPFLPKENWKRLGPTSFANGENLAVHIGNWGPGHAAPPKDLILKTLRKLADGVDIKEAARCLAEDSNASDTNERYIHWFNADVDEKWSPSAYCTQDQNGLYLSIDASGLSSGHDVEYAAYLFSGNERLSTIWYQDKPDLNIPLSNKEIDTIRVFVRDIWGNVRLSEIKAPTHALSDIEEESLPSYY